MSSKDTAIITAFGIMSTNRMTEKQTLLTMMNLQGEKLVCKQKQKQQENMKKEGFRKKRNETSITTKLLCTVNSG